jgi:hypothetical protein
MGEYLRDAVAKIFNTKRLQGPVNSLNDMLLADFTTILEYLPVEKCEYVMDCIKKAVQEDVNPNRYSYLNNRMRVKIGELAAKHFSFKHDQGELLSTITDQLLKFRFFENVDAIRKMETIHQSANLLSQVAFYTDKHDALCINFVRALTDQILNFGKN